MLQDEKVAHAAARDDGLPVRAVVVAEALPGNVGEEVVHRLFGVLLERGVAARDPSAAVAYEPHGRPVDAGLQLAALPVVK